MQGVLLLGTALAAYLGFALLALGQGRHLRRVAALDPPRGLRLLALRVAAGIALALSLTLALLRDGPSFGALLWATAVSLAALAVALTLAWRPLWLRPLSAAFLTRPGDSAGRAKLPE